MRRNCLHTYVLGLLTLAVVSAAFAQHDAKHGDSDAANAQEASTETPVLCPVTGKPIDRAVFARFRGKRVYFADKSCVEKFLADPSEYAEALKAQWKALTPLRVQVACPVTGEPIDKQFFVETPERDIYFASAEAKAKWEASAEKFADKLDSCYSFQTHCGTCPGEYNPQVFEEHDGRRIYFCCPGCRGVFQKDPAKFMKDYEAGVAANEAAWKKLHAAASDKPTDSAKPVKP